MFVFMPLSLGSPFLEIFNEVNDDGDAWCHVSDYEDNVSPAQMIQMLCCSMESKGLGIFTVAASLPGVVEKIDPQIIEQEGEKFMLFRLAPLLGLPADDDLKELQEFKSLMIFFKEQALTMLNNRVALQLHRGFGDTALSVLTQNKEFEATLQEAVNQRIKASPVLSRWLENQKKGIEHTHPQLDNLFCTLDAFNLFNEQEFQLWQENQPQASSSNWRKCKKSKSKHKR